MDINKVVFWGLHVITGVLYLYGLIRFLSAKRIDDTLKVEMNLRSKIEFFGIVALNAAAFVYQPTKETVGVANFMLAPLLLLTYLSLERMVVVGRRILYTKFLAFDIRHIKSKEYKKGLFTFKIRDGVIKVRFPITDPDYLMQMLSGSYRKSRSSKK